MTFWVGSGRVGLTSGQLIFGPIHLSYKTRNCVENFWSGMVQFWPIWVSGLLSCEHISDVESGRSGLFSSGFESIVSFVRSNHSKIFQWPFFPEI